MLLGTITIWYFHLIVVVFHVRGALTVSMKELEQTKCKYAFLLHMFSHLINEVASWI